jgi:hypothetical protein
MSEIETALLERQNEERKLTTTSIKSYTRQYEYITKFFNQDGKENWISNSSQISLINKLTKMETSDSNRLSYLNVFIIVRKYNGIDIDELIGYRVKLMKINKKDVKNKLIELKLPTCKEITDYIKELYKSRDYVNFIVNSLCWNFTLRNKDLNLYIINNAEYQTLDNKTDNFLVIMTNETKLVIQDYKTATIYDTKIIRNRSKKVYNACKALGTGFLLQNDRNESIKMDNLSYYIRLYYDEKNDKKLTERDYMKRRVLDAQQQSHSLNKLNEIARNRGVSLQTVQSHYNADIE